MKINGKNEITWLTVEHTLKYPTRTETYGEVTFASGRTPGAGFDLSDADVTVGHDEAITETDFIYDVSRWLLALPYESRTLDLSGAVQSKSRTYYDGAPPGMEL